MWDILDEIDWYPSVWHPAEYVVSGESLFADVTFIVDGIECAISKPINRVAEEAFFSTKKGKHAIKYQTVVHLTSGRLMYISGGIPGAIHDAKLYQYSTLPQIIPEGEMGLADKGYNGIDPDHLLYLIKPQRVPIDEPLGGLKVFRLEERIYNRCISALRIEVERVNSRIKRFAIMDDCRSRDKLLHHVKFTTVCQLVNIWSEICPMRKELHPLLFDCPIIRPDRAQ